MLRQKLKYQLNYHLIISSLKMFCQETFIAECNEFLRSNSYEDYEDVKTDIETFVESNLSPELISCHPNLYAMILDTFMAYDFESYSPAEETINLDNILFETVEIWLAAAAENSNKD
jgi:hypothetical protein